MAKWNKDSTIADAKSFGEDPKHRKKIRRRRILAATFILTCLAIAGFAAKPAYHKIRDIRLDRNLSDAQAAARTEDWATARNLARSVLIARPTDFEAFRVWFRALSHIDEPRTYLVAASLFTHPDASRQDRLDALAVLARQGPHAVALSAYASMEESMREEPAALAAIAPLLVMRGQGDHVVRILRDNPGDPPLPAATLELIRALCADPTPERVDEARELFAGLIEQDAWQAALDALLILGETPKGLAHGKPLPPLPPWVRAQPNTTTRHHLVALQPEIDLAGGPQHADSIIQPAIDRYLDADPATLGTWLIGLDRADIANVVLEQAAESCPESFIAHVNSLIRLQRLDEATTRLATPPDAIDLVDLELTRAAAFRMLGDRSAEATAWTRALNNAAFDQTANRFLEIARFATAIGVPGGVAEDAWVAAVRVGWGPIPLYGDLVHIYASLGSMGRSEDLLAMSRTLLRFEPQNPELINNYHYLALVHQVAEPRDVLPTLESLIEDHPERTEFHSALAFAHLMNGDAAAALEQAAKLREITERPPPLTTSAIEGTARILNGEEEQGQSILGQIDWRRMMRAETVAFRHILTRAEFDDIPLPEIRELTPVLDPEDIPAWRRAVERLERDRAEDSLPPLAAPLIPATENSLENDN